MKEQVLRFILWGLFFGAQAGAAPYPIESPLGGVSSPYSAPLLERVKQLIAQGVSAERLANLEKQKATVQIQCKETPGNSVYIGLEQGMIIEAPISVVAGVYEDFDHYKELFPDYENIKVLNRDQNKIETFWEQKIPVFFVPNIKFEMLYLMETSVPERRVYRYQLKKAGTIRANDGFSFLQKLGEHRTLYIEHDYFDADWGPVRFMGAKKIWHDSVEGIYLSDLAIKLKAENPAWTSSKALSEAQKQLGPDNGRIDLCFENRVLERLSTGQAPSK